MPSPGKVDAGGLADAEAVHILVEAGWAEFIGDPGETDVERVAHAGGHIDRASGAAVPVVDGDAADPEGAGIEHDGVRRDRARVERGGHGQNFEDRAGFVGCADRAVEGQFVFGAGFVNITVKPVLVQIHARLDRHGENFARFGVHDHDRAALGAVVFKRLIEDIFGHGLNLAVDGENQTGASRDLEEALDIVGIVIEKNLERFSTQQFIILGLNAKISHRCGDIEIGVEAQDVGSQGAFGIAALEHWAVFEIIQVRHELRSFYRTRVWSVGCLFVQLRAVSLYLGNF